MKNNTIKAWSAGFLLIVFFTIISEATVAFNDYIFHRLGFNRNITLILLWLLPCLASFIAVYYSRSKEIISTISYLLILPFLGSTVHYIHGYLGGTVDFKGIAGAIVTFKIYFLIGSISIITGAILAFVISKTKL
ncbi:hypothetical protein [Zooshikella ganghwensis]|uniref:hypothetical protein n=1 Tax=Zooshikella ganghwensis TaxID=202772 RepID=UPI0004898553|nr:hypothetical protein [Zooshikella ganghwensis]